MAVVAGSSINWSHSLGVRSTASQLSGKVSNGHRRKRSEAVPVALESISNRTGMVQGIGALQVPEVITGCTIRKTIGIAGRHGSGIKNPHPLHQLGNTRFQLIWACSRSWRAWCSQSAARFAMASPPDQGFEGSGDIGLAHQGFAHQHRIGTGALDPVQIVAGE